VSNWLITGGCGFIGSSLIQELVASDQKINIRVLDNLSVGTKEDLSGACEFQEVTSEDMGSSPKGIELFVGDICDEQTCLTSAIGVDVIVHLAANTGVGPSVEMPRVDMEANVIGVFNMLEAARSNGVDKFIFASSGAPIGELIAPPIHEELAAHPVSPYGASKLAGEGYCSAYFQTYGVNTIVLRFGNVYGPGSEKKESVVAKFIKLAKKGEVCEIYGKGSQTRDFIYISDLVDAICKSDKANVGGEVFQIASNKEVTVNEIAELIKEKLKGFGVDLELTYGEARAGDVMRNYSDTSKAKLVLDWVSKTNLDVGLDKTISSFCNLS